MLKKLSLGNAVATFAIGAWFIRYPFTMSSLFWVKFVQGVPAMSIIFTGMLLIALSVKGFSLLRGKGGTEGLPSYVFWNLLIVPPSSVLAFESAYSSVPFDVSMLWGFVQTLIVLALLYPMIGEVEAGRKRNWVVLAAGYCAVTVIAPILSFGAYSYAVQESLRSPMVGRVYVEHPVKTPFDPDGIEGKSNVLRISSVITHERSLEGKDYWRDVQENPWAFYHREKEVEGVVLSNGLWFDLAVGEFAVSAKSCPYTYAVVFDARPDSTYMELYTRKSGTDWSDGWRGFLMKMGGRSWTLPVRHYVIHLSDDYKKNGILVEKTLRW